jgi:hypothetical protein
MQEVLSAIPIETGRRTEKIKAEAAIGIARYPAQATNVKDMLRTACEDMGMTMEELAGEDSQLQRAA